MDAVTASSSPAISRVMQWSTKVRVAMTCVLQCASSKRVFWKSRIGLPNACRSRTYSSVSTTAASAMASASTAIARRSRGSWFMSW